MKEEKARVKYVMENKKRLEMEKIKLDTMKREKHAQHLLRFLEYDNKCTDFYPFFIKF